MFKSFSYLFQKYESSLFKKLVDKLRNELGSQNVISVKGSTFLEALYKLHLDDLEERNQIRLLKTKLDEKRDSESQITVSPSKRSMANQIMKDNASQLSGSTNSLAERIQNQRQEVMTNHVTMARKAHRVDKAPQTVSLIGKKGKSAGNQSNHDILNELEQLDATIYKEGREKRAKQNLLENLMHCTKNTSKQYDKLIGQMKKMEKLYEKVHKFCKNNAPELLADNAEPCFDAIEDYADEKDFYNRIMASGMFD